MEKYSLRMLEGIMLRKYLNVIEGQHLEDGENDTIRNFALSQILV
jgi:hypothetical protein